jgi:putative addiction module component (TIGR02574 family)
MAPEVEKVYEEALKLTEDQRVALAGRLLSSVDPEIDPEWESAWSDEIARRIADVDGGRVRPIPWDEVERMMQATRDAHANNR